MQDQEQKQMPLIDQFKQQMLKAWQPVPSLTKTIIMFFILSAIFLGLGIPMIILSANIQEYSVRYDESCPISSSALCSVSLKVDYHMQGPIYVYYQLKNYYQNHRLYAKSMSDSQLKGNTITTDIAQADCQPIVYNKDLYVKTSVTGATLNPDGIAYPCGVIAYTIFNDSYTLTTSTTNLTILGTGIAWPSDTQKYVVKDNSTMWYDITDERFMNWMRISSMPDFRKLWGRIEGSLSSGTYTVNIKNQFDVSKFKGQKYFVITQANFFGSKNQFLSITYIVVGALCLVIAVVFLVKKLMKQKTD